MKKSNLLFISFLLFTVIFSIWFRSTSRTKKSIDPAYTESKIKIKKTSFPIAVDDSVISPEKESYSLLELPAFLKNDAVVYHFAYTLCYNEKYEQASWVAYELTTDELIKRYDRTNRFIVDQAIKTNSADESDYKKSGYDRGHLAPAGDMSWSARAMEESFYYSNMSPQDPSFNRGIWKKLEEQVRSWAGELGTVYVVTGPVLKGEMNTIGHNNVAVPKYYYKVILDNNGNKPKAIGFIMRNEGSKGSLSNYAVSIDSVENFTGIDFFPILSDKTEQKVEHSICVSCWNWSIQQQPRNTTSTISTAVQCSGITKKGLRCKRRTKDPSGKCYQHD
jgi:endonuclease G